MRSALGPDRIVRTGNIKYDTEGVKSDSTQPRAILESLGISPRSEVIFGGSTHAGEEMILAEIFIKLRPDFPELFLVIAPRHVERARNLRARLEEHSLGVALRSAPNSTRPDCLLIDTTGELRDWYSVATIAFVGKSLTARGGQNPVEPIVAGKPVLFGPHMENFATLSASLVRHGGAVQVGDAVSLQREIAKLFREPAAGARLVENATEVLAAHRGATAATAELLSKLSVHA